MEYFLIVLFITSVAGLDYIDCPGLPAKPGVTLECVSKLGAMKFNCSNPMPADTVVFYNCMPYYKERTPNIFEAKSLRCDNGRWARYNYFREFTCDYECGKALPSTKTTVIKGQLVSRTTWPWHVLIYLKLNWAKVSEAVNYRRTVLATGGGKRKYDDAETMGMGDDQEDEQYSYEGNYGLDPVKLAEIFDNDDLSREEIFDPRYRYIYICGGTLVTDTMVLTAAHCMTDVMGQMRSTKEFMVVLGGTSNHFYENMEDESKAQIIPVWFTGQMIRRIHIAEDFNYDQYRSDIALVELFHPAALNKAVLPACLPENRDDAQLFIANKKHGEAVGSMINIYKEGVSNQLKSKKLQVLPNIDCVRNIQRLPSDKEFCAGSLSTCRLTPSDECAHICSGDSGGGLIATLNFGLKRKNTVQGIISYARARRACENYAVFTRVYKFVPWIKSIIDAHERLPLLPVFTPMPA